tara:strand:- start:386 stop:646 length:261 start_codon:yes stop_codon:yes gene_type:complete
MGKKKSRATYVSKGERRSVVNGKHHKSDWTPLQEANHKIDAWAKGKKVFLTIENPNKNETAKPFIRVPAEHVWKKYEPYRMKQSSE